MAASPWTVLLPLGMAPDGRAVEIVRRLDWGCVCMCVCVRVLERDWRH